jgi:O-antigen/teichoic acid export membrane protein
MFAKPRDGDKRGIKKGLFISSGKVFLLQGMGILLTCGLQVLISHTCGAAGLGAYALFVSWLGILSILTVPGLEGTLVFFLPRYEGAPDCRRKVVRACLFVVGVTSLLLALTLLAAWNRAFQWAGLPSNARIAFALSIVTFSFAKLLDALFLGMRDAPAASYFNVVRTILRILFCLPIFLFPKNGWTIVLLSLAIEGCLTLLLRIRSARRRYPELFAAGRLEGSSDPLDNRAIAANAAPMFGISITDGLYPFLDKAILGAMLPLELVGIYRVSDSIASLNSAFVGPFVSFWPYISKLYKEKRMTELCDAYRSINLLIITLMIPFSLALIELSGWVLSLFGPEFAARGRIVFLILALGCVVDAIAGPAGAVLKMTKHPRLSLYISTVLLLMYGVLSIAFTKRFGVVGIAAAKATVMIAGNVTNVIANLLLLRIFPYSWKHAWILALGVGVFTASCAAQGFIVGTRSHFVMAFGEVCMFACGAAVILRARITQITKFAKGWMSGQLALANYWQS